MTHATAQNIWRVPAYLPYLQPPLTDDAIAEAERTIGFEFPPEFLSLLATQNGGYIRFELPETTHEIIAGIGAHFPSLTGFDWDECQEYVSSPLSGLVPFDGDGHWHLCLDYRSNSGSPSISFVDIECDDEFSVASSFAAYLSLLRLNVGDEYVVESVADVEELKSKLSSQLGIEFDSPTNWANGYPVHRARISGGSNPEWVWFNPNSVPRGFVRSNDPRYDELKDLMPGNALQFPEIANDSFILNTTSGIRSRVIEACIESHFNVRPLRDFV